MTDHTLCTFRVMQDDTCVATAPNPETAFRIKACLDACAGIPTEQLEKASMAKLVKALARAHGALREGLPISSDIIDEALAPFRKD